MRKFKRPLNRSITIGCVIFIILLCIFLCIGNLTLYKKYVFNDYQGYIADILNYTLSHIDGDDLKVCIDTKEESEKFKESLLFMDDLMNHFQDIHYFYSILPLNTNETGNVMSVLSAERYHDRYIDTEGNLYLGWISDDEYDAATASQLVDIMNGGSIVYFEEETEWGTDYTGAVPVRDSKGNAIAILAVDIDISFIHEMIVQYTLNNIIIVSVLGILFIIFFLLWSRANITMPIRKLEQSAVGFADRSHGLRSVDSLSFEAPEMHSDNEIKSLSDAVVKMTNDMRDYITEIVDAETKAATMEELANRDALTGVGNKTAYTFEVEKLDKQLKEGRHTDIGLAVVDLNYLKKINDTYGHEKGDFAIKKLSRLICDTFVSSGVYRIGGDEFVIILQENDYDNCEQLCKDFYKKLAEIDKDQTLEPWERISAALGEARYDPAMDEGMHSLFQRADQIMYERKKAMKAVRME